MSKIKVVNEIDIYEEDDEDVATRDKILRIESHWHMNDRVVLIIGKKRYTLIAQDLKKAIENATNAT